MLPLMDMINHKYGNRTNLGGLLIHGTHLSQTATCNIEKGEEVFWNYNLGGGHRVDLMFGTYGYVIQQDPPLLCAGDLPDYELRKLAGTYPLTDDEYYGPQGAFNSEHEYLRLQGLLKSMPTSTGDDERILAAINPEDWQDAEIIKFRMERKRALLRAMNRISLNLKRT